MAGLATAAGASAAASPDSGADPLAIAALLVSVFAVCVSGVALYRTHFAGFRPLFVAGVARLRVYPIRNDSGRWFIASVDAQVSVSNSGARPGRVSALRLRVEYPDLPIPGAREYLPAKFEIEPGAGRRISRERFRWIDEIVVGQAGPFLVLPRETVTRHVVFEKRWDEPVTPGEVVFVLETRSDAKPDWVDVDQWQFHLLGDSWGELAEVGSSFSASPQQQPQDGSDETAPDDLHRYTGGRGEVREGGFGMQGSYLDYPDAEEFSQDT